MWESLLVFLFNNLLLPLFKSWLFGEIDVFKGNKEEAAAAEKAKTEIKQGYDAVKAAPTVQEKMNAFEKMLADRRKRLGIVS